MVEAAGSPRRERVERNIYRRGTGVFEVGFRDAAGKQRWRTVAGGITAARALRDELVARRNRGEHVVHRANLRFADVAEKWLAGPVSDLLGVDVGTGPAVDVRMPVTVATVDGSKTNGTGLEQTVAAAAEPWRTLFILAALTGARVSELLALTWADVRLGDLDDAEVEFAWQVDRKGERRPTKTDGSARTVPMPRELARILVRHKLSARFAQPEHFVFSTRTGGPFRQRNVCRALRNAQRDAVDGRGRPTFPALHAVDAAGKPAAIAHGALPSMHSFRHTVASRALLAGESIDEIAFLLGHRDANVTRAVYVRELADTRRRSMRRSRMLEEFSEILKP